MTKAKHQRVKDKAAPSAKESRRADEHTSMHADASYDDTGHDVPYRTADKAEGDLVEEDDEGAHAVD